MRPMPPTRRGYDPPEVVSALQKAVRRSDTDAALYWSIELALSGYGNWCWKRIRTICSEDIGPAVPGLAADVRALYENWKEEQGKGDGILYVIHAVIMLAEAPKCRVTDWVAHYHCSDRVERREIPDEALDKHTRRGKQMGRGIEHFIDESSRLVQPTSHRATYEREQRELVQRMCANDPTLPTNPIRSAPATSGAAGTQLPGMPA
ncbi:MAG TPA: hypothetical protein PKB03_10260 [Baekduia sp.]|nr:hypothetical protein [Baekduia sp.]